MSMQQIWQQLANLALVGTSAKPLGQFVMDTEQMGEGFAALMRQVLSTPQNVQQGEHLARNEQKLLAAAGVLAWAQEVGYSPLSDSLALPQPSATNQAAPASAAIAACLSEIFDADLLPCLTQWLRLAEAHQIAADPIHLVRLLDIGRQQVALRPALLRVLDQRGRWLAQLNPAWNWLAQTAFADISANEVAPSWWLEGSLEQRCSYLRAQRSIDAEAARALLQAGFAQEKASARTSLLACLALGLQDADEPMLEAALDDRAKAVRQQAMQLLARLPNSAWRARMRARAQACLHLVAESGGLGGLIKGMFGAAQPKLNLQLSLPSACDAAMQRDGVDEKPPPGTGERAWWLSQMLAVLPIGEWCACEYTAEVLLAAIEKSEWRDLLLKAVQQSCLLQQDAQLAYLLLQGGDMSLALLRLLSATEQSVMLQRSLQDLLSQPLAVRNSLPNLQDIYGAPDFVWSAELSQLFLQVVQAGVMACAVEHESHRLRHSLMQVMYVLELNSLERWWQSLDEWEKSRMATYGTTNLPEKLNQLLAFRRKMETAFAELSKQTSSNLLLEKT